MAARHCDANWKKWYCEVNNTDENVASANKSIMQVTDDEISKYTALYFQYVLHNVYEVVNIPLSNTYRL
jgi:hypothetical protein